MNYSQRINVEEATREFEPFPVVYFSLSFPELSQTFVFNEIRSIAELGGDIRVLSCKAPSGNRSNLPKVYGYEDRVDTIFNGAESSGRARRLMAAVRAASKLLIRNPALLPNILSAARSGDSVVPFSTKLAIADRLQSQPDSIVHCHFGPAGKVIADLKKHGLVRSPITTVFHGYDITQYLVESTDAYDTLFAEADLLIPISDFWHRRLVELGAPSDKIRTIRLGVDSNAFKYKQRAAAPGEATRFITIGRMTEKKGHRYTVEAFKALAARRPDLNICLDVIGDGPDLQEIQAISQSNARITLHGALAHQDVRAMLDQSHIFVLPSVVAANGDMEGIPVSIMEAMAMGLPVISTHHSGIPELVADGSSGILVGERDVGALSAAMEKLGSQPELLLAMGKAGRAIIEREYNERTQARVLMNELSKISSKQ
ncbi:colanic acid/amylovoran biosynthesis glycosyltransferase [Rhizobium sp. BK529]|uniref:glycosyltransferase n=1 Tax=unclassified Rhizobium TaxID=2613769 RepID=UPI00104D1F6A|nr:MULTISPECIES: glycosyltransferase [unclassified Rhizobium]MBB3595710.1 colanic acid/amylovoran biosynthesis glycosyltransferase [Rhizobium sp. BK529]TCR98263.1 colanic acid/amylovoran biosynthesis glycosyltransferase [Rhizobium sp. BK418]